MEATFFCRANERGYEEPKSKGGIERERQCRNKLKGSSVLQNISSLWKGCVNVFYSQVGRVRLSLCELNKGTLVYTQVRVL